MTLNRIKGTLYGLAIGDAIGAPVEFMTPDSFPRVSAYSSGGKFNLDAGEWTDDTAMALCLAEALTKSPTLNSRVLLDLFLDWLYKGHNTTQGKAIGIGQQTFKALAHYRKTGELVTPFRDSKYSGNGALMRLAPVCIKFHYSLDETREYAIQSSEVTHASPESIQAAYLMGGIIYKCINGVSKEGLTIFINGHKGRLNHPSMERLICLDIDAFDPSNSGYAPLSLEAALKAFFTTDSFENGMLQVVNNGMDSDTVGAIYGQIAGAFYGIEGIPSNWIEELKRKDLINQYLNDLVSISELSSFELDKSRSGT